MFPPPTSPPRPAALLWLAVAAGVTLVRIGLA